MKQTIRLEDVSGLATQGTNPIIEVEGKPVLRIKDYGHRNEGQRVRDWAFLEPFMLISHLTGRPWCQSSPPTCQIHGCNLRCAYCFNPPGGEVQTHDVSVQALTQAAFESRNCIRISGGEPLFADPEGVKSIIEAFPPTGLVWLDTNLTQDVDWDELIPDGTRCQVAVCGCFKGLNQDCVDAYVRRADGQPLQLTQQFEVAGKLWHSKIDYVFFYVPAIFAKEEGAMQINETVCEFAQRLQDDIAADVILVTTPIEIRNYGSCIQEVPGFFEADFGNIRRAWDSRVLGAWERSLPQYTWAQRRSHG